MMRWMWFILLIVVASAVAYVGSILWRKHIYRQAMVSPVLIAEQLGAISDERLETERLLPSEPVFFLLSVVGTNLGSGSLTVSKGQHEICRYRFSSSELKRSSWLEKYRQDGRILNWSQPFTNGGGNVKFILELTNIQASSIWIAYTMKRGQLSDSWIGTRTEP